MELYDYIRIFTRRWWVIALLLVAGTGAAYVFSIRQPPRYRTTTILLLNPAASSELLTPGMSAASGAAPALGGAERLARSYDQYLKTRAFTTIVAQQLNLPGVTPGALSAAITTALVPNTNFYNLTITWGNRQQAQAIANGIARIFIEENRKLQLASQPAGTFALTLMDSLGVYERRVNQLRLEREELEYNSRLPDKERRDRLADVESRLLTAEDTYAKLLASTAQTRAVEDARISTATVVDEAPLPGRPISPNLPLNVLFGAAVSLAVGAGLAAALNYLEDSVEGPEDVERASGQGVLGLITQLPGTYGEQARRKRRRAAAAAATVEGAGHAAPPSDEAPPPVPLPAPPAAANSTVTRNDALPAAGLATIGKELIAIHQPQHPIAESFRMLRTSIQFSSLSATGGHWPLATGQTAPPTGHPPLVTDHRPPATTLVVTSAMPSEGKSTVAGNLAVVFAQAGQRVLLVDADLRNPSLHRLFGISGERGFTSLLLEERAASLDDVPAPIAGLPGLRVLPVGPLPPNPSELLGSPRATQVLAALAAQCDLVVFDTPPAGLVTDAAVLAARCDGVVVVAWSGRTRRAALAGCVQTLQKVGARPLGTVLNKVKPHSLGRYGGYYYRYYRYGYRYGYGSNGSNDTNGIHQADGTNGTATKGKLFGLLGSPAANGAANGVHNGVAQVVTIPTIPDTPAKN